MGSGISDEWEVIREDEDARRIAGYMYNYYRLHKDKFLESARKWDMAHPEKRKAIAKAQYKRKPRIPSYQRYKEYFREQKRIQRKRIKEMDKRRKIICIYGMSGTGKTTASLYLKKKFGVNVICSYTTRPKRPKEVDGVDHWFVSTVPPREELLAYTRYGNYEYYAKKEDVKGRINVYVIDENGIKQLMKLQDEFRIYPVRIDATKKTRLMRGVLPIRIGRDAERDTSGVRARCIIKNNGCVREFRQNLVNMFNKIAMY